MLMVDCEFLWVVVVVVVGGGGGGVRFVVQQWWAGGGGVNSVGYIPTIYFCNKVKGAKHIFNNKQ